MQKHDICICLSVWLSVQNKYLFNGLTYQYKIRKYDLAKILDELENGHSEVNSEIITKFKLTLQDPTQKTHFMWFAPSCSKKMASTFI